MGIHRQKHFKKKNKNIKRNNLPIGRYSDCNLYKPNTFVYIKINKKYVQISSIILYHFHTEDCS